MQTNIHYKLYVPWLFTDIAIKQKYTRTDENMKEVVKAQGEIDKEAEEWYKEREQKRMVLFMELEETRRRGYSEEEEKHCQVERLHEERMQYKFFSFSH